MSDRESAPDLEAESIEKNLQPRVSLRGMMLWVLVIALVVALIWADKRRRFAEAELAKLRLESGYLNASTSDEIAASRFPSDLPLTYNFRVRVPESPRYRVAYSSVWRKEDAAPTWFSAIDLPAGESVVIVRVLEDPRDERWKITTLVRSSRGTKRMATVLPDDHVKAFRGSHDAISMGVKQETVKVPKDESIRLLDERWLVGEGAMLLYGDRPPSRDQIGIFAELQPDVGTL